MHKLILGDSLVELKKLENESIDLIYADPPYGKYDIVLLTEKVLEHLNEKGLFFLECDKNQVPFLECEVIDFGQTRILKWEKK